MSLDNKISQLAQNGLSVTQVSKELGITYHRCRARFIKLGLKKPNLKRCCENKAECLDCKKIFDIKEFPELLQYGSYRCRNCLSSKNHKYQIAKLGCTKEKFQELLELQNNKCAICKSDFGHISKNGVKSRLAVDHDHTTNHIRGLLCGRCNRGLGYLKEENLCQALIYCKKC